MSPRDHTILDAIERGDRPSQIALRHSLSVAAVRKVARKHGITPQGHRAGPPKASEEEPLTPLARRIGKRLCRWRTWNNDLSYTEAAAMLGIPRQRVLQLERGTAAANLIELEKLAAAMGVTPSALLA